MNSQGKQVWQYSRCKTSMVRKKCKLKKWLALPCSVLEPLAATAPLQRAVGEIWIGGQTIHQSHDAVHEPILNMWFCRTCGFYGDITLHKFAAPCSGRINKWGRMNLANIDKGLIPGKSARAVAYNSQRLATRARAPAARRGPS